MDEQDYFDLGPFTKEDYDEAVANWLKQEEEDDE